jgi:hypothetical protein
MFVKRSPQPPGIRILGKDLLATIFVPELQGTDGRFGLENHVSVLGTGWAGEAQARGGLGGPDLDRWTSSFGDEPQQDGFCLLLAIRRLARGKHSDARPDSALRIDDLERATAQDWELALSQSRTDLLCEAEKQEGKIDQGESNEASWCLHVVPAFGGLTDRPSG